MKRQAERGRNHCTGTYLRQHSKYKLSQFCFVLLLCAIVKEIILNYSRNTSNVIEVPPEECTTFNIHHTYKKIDQKAERVAGYSGR